MTSSSLGLVCFEGPTERPMSVDTWFQGFSNAQCRIDTLSPICVSDRRQFPPSLRKTSVVAVAGHVHSYTRRDDRAFTPAVKPPRDFWSVRGMENCP